MKVKFEATFNAAANRVVIFTRDEAPGAIPNGTLVFKRNSQPGDAHLDGAPAHVMGSIEIDGHYGYFIEWLDKPNTPVFIVGSRIDYEWGVV